MKKIVALAMAMLCAGIFAGCGSKPEPLPDDSVTIREGQSVRTVADKIIEEAGIPMPAEIDDGVLKDLFYIDPAADAEEYYGKMSMSITSADNIVAVKAKSGRKQAVADGLNKRLADVRASFEQYLPDQREKSQKGQVVEKGDYVFLLILGQDLESFDDDMEKAVGIINDAF